ncbi:hypothetical protein [Sphingomonas sp. OTU376]|uniref:hypothetical protein n=1 Tax=Sphingomonas sp. OTU376 TaxID=3043863 RepID=UPI00313DA488
MPKTRIEAAQAVAQAFFPAEQAAQDSAAQGARCIATIIEQRIKAQLPPQTGAEALALIATATGQAVAAANSFADAHKLLAGLSEDLGIPLTFGPDCEPNATKLHVVAA